MWNFPKGNKNGKPLIIVLARAFLFLIDIIMIKRYTIISND